jgi:hypothetical protein
MKKLSQTGNRLYKRVGRGSYLINIPVAFTRKDVTSKKWNDLRNSLIDNVDDLLFEALYQVERDVKNKK